MPLTLGTGSTADPAESVPALDLDVLGYVHLRGSLLTNGAPAFTLPAGVRPATESHFVASDNGDRDRASGHRARTASVEVTGVGPVSFDGITFKAGG